MSRHWLVLQLRPLNAAHISLFPSVIQRGLGLGVWLMAFFPPAYFSTTKIATSEEDIGIA